MNLLTEKVVVVTGSSRGIGLAIAKACAGEGACVVINSRSAAAVEQACNALRQQGFRVSGIAADVARQEEIEKLLEHALETWGRVDVWINNAGLSGGYRPLDEMGQEEISEIVNVNLVGTMTACRLIIPYFIRQNGGVLINMSGKGGRGKASPYLAAYAATKAAVTSLTRSLAEENRAHPISIHSVLPGMVETDFYRDIKTSPKLKQDIEHMPYILKAFGVPADVVGRFFIKLAAQEPGKVTGRTYSLLGGRRLVRAVGLMMWYRMSGKLRRTD